MLFIFWLIVIAEFVKSAVNRDLATVPYPTGSDFFKNENEIIPFPERLCPAKPTASLFTVKCKTDKDCKIIGGQCCQEGKRKICRQGVLQKSKEQDHLPLLPGVPLSCPTTEAIIEFLPIQNCTKDRDCLPRICCPDGSVSYCRTAVPKLDSALSPDMVKTLKNVMSYLRCTAPPPPSLDFFPKPCKNTLDCLPNLCCQEKGKKICRPPRRSVLALISNYIK